MTAGHSPPAARDDSPSAARYGILTLLALAPASAYLTRIISAANTTIAAEFAEPPAVMGDVMAGFALGYFAFQVPGGFVAGAWGVRRTLPALSLGWSLCALASSFARNADELWLARVAIGVAQAGLVPCCAQAIRDWFPVAQRGLASSVMAGSMQVGAIAATELTARLLGPLGWRGALQAYSLTGAVWAVAFYLWFRDRPPTAQVAEPGSRSPSPQILTRAPQATTEGLLTPAAVVVDDPDAWGPFLWRMAGSLSVWAFFVQAVFRAYAYEFFTTWCPAFLEKGYGVNPVAAASLTAWPLWTLGIGGLLAGYAVDWVLVKTGRPWLSRSGLACLGLASCGACFALGTQVADPRTLMLLIAAGAACASLGGPATWATAMDLGGRRAAVLAGAMNMMGNLGAYLCPKQVGRLFDSIEKSEGNWKLVLWLFAGVNLAGAVTWLFVRPRQSTE